MTQLVLHFRVELGIHKADIIKESDNVHEIDAGREDARFSTFQLETAFPLIRATQLAEIRQRRLKGSFTNPGGNPCS